MTKTDDIIPEGYKRITEILWHFSEIKHVDPAVIAKAADRGTRVHNCCEAFIEGIGAFVDEDIKGYIDSFHTWWPIDMKIVHMEKRFSCHSLSITGKVDLIMQDHEGNLHLYDLKTSYRPSKTWSLQGNGYKYLASVNGIDISTINFVHLMRNSAPAKIITYPTDVDLFLKVVEVYNYFYA